ncbi:protein-glutamate O-methyltransferase [Noviherbaspirillum agri]
MGTIDITEKEFSQFQRFIYEATGISLAPSKKSLVTGRLAKRLQHYRLGSYAEYFALLASGSAREEVQTAIDLLTTNETYFFREPQHFELLRAHALETHRHTETYRVWSAACSTGEEAFSIAMVLADCLGHAPWEVIGTDVSTRVLHAATAGHYPMDRARHMPPDCLHRFCLKGIGEQAGTLLIDRQLRNRVRFQQANLNEALPELGRFDVIFLRNVMIYFNEETKRQVVARVLALLKPGGHFYIGHSESLHNLSDSVSLLGPSVYRKP